MKTAILFSGTMYNFKYSIKSLMENLVIPNDADVFILTSRYNMMRKAGHTEKDIVAENNTEWHSKAMGMCRDESKSILFDDVQLIRDTFGDRLKGFWFIDDMPQYQQYLTNERLRMMGVINTYRVNNLELGINPPFGGDVIDPERNGNVRCVIDQYNHIKACYELMERYEAESGVHYDYVMRARIDFVCPFRFELAHYYLGHDEQFFFNFGVWRWESEKFEWADEFAFFGKRANVDRVFKSLNHMGFITDRKYKTFYAEQNNDFRFSPECQWSILLQELEANVKPLQVFRSSCFTDGKDGFDYMNYMFKPVYHIEEEYIQVCKSKTDINEHLPTLRKYADECDHITELGTRYGNSTIAFMAAQMNQKKRLITYDVAHNPKIDFLITLGEKNELDFVFKLENPQEIEETDLLFIDTDHHVEQCSKELALHHSKVRKYMIFHDTTTFWENGQGHDSGGGGLRYAIEPFLESHPEWKIKERFTNNNGLLILQNVNSIQSVIS